MFCKSRFTFYIFNLVFAMSSQKIHLFVRIFFIKLKEPFFVTVDLKNMNEKSYNSLPVITKLGITQGCILITILFNAARRAKCILHPRVCMTQF